MSILNDIEQKLKEAQKQKNEVAISTLRLILASLKNFEIANRNQEVNDETLIKVLKKEEKKRKESIEAYRKGGRNELAEREWQELDIVQGFLPPEMSTDDIRAIVDKVIAGLGGPAAVNFGQVMGETMKQIGSQASGQTVSQIVKKALADN